MNKLLPIACLLLVSCGTISLPEPKIAISYVPAPTASPLPIAISKGDNRGEVNIPTDDDQAYDGPVITKTYDVNGYRCRLVFMPGINRLDIYRNRELVHTYSPGEDELVEFDLDRDGLDEALTHCTPI